MKFDREAAKAAGYTDKEIDEFLRKPIESFQKDEGIMGAAGNPVLENILQGATFGFSDELQAGMKSGYDKLTGDKRDFAEIYKQNARDVRYPLEQYNKENPLKAAGLNIIGGIATGGGLGVAASKKLPGLANYAKTNPLMSASIGGIGSGTVSGAGYAPTVEEMPQYMKSGAITGAVLPSLASGAGAAGKFVSKPIIAGAKKLAGALDTPSQRAAGMVSNALKRDDLGLKDYIKRQSDLGEGSLMVDVGKVNTQRLAQTIASTPGKAANMAEDVLQSRMMKSPQRLIGKMRGILNNNTSAYRYMKDVTGNMKRTAGPLYEQAKKESVDPELMNGYLTNLAKKIDDYEGTTIGTNLKAIKRSLVNRKNKTEIPKTEIKRLHAAKMDLDVRISNSIKDYKPTPLTAELMEQKRALLDILDSSESYKNARKIYSDDSSILSSVKMGKGILKKDAEEMFDTISVMSDADKKGFITGAMQAISDTLAGTKEGANAARKLATPLIKQRLRSAFNNEKEYNNFIKGLEAEDVFAEVRNNVLRGSQTQQRIDTAGVTALEVGTDISMGRWVSGLLDATKAFMRGERKIPEPVRDEIANLLFKDAVLGKTKVSSELAKKLKRHDIAAGMANNLLLTMKSGVPVASGNIGAMMEQQ